MRGSSASASTSAAAPQMAQRMRQSLIGWMSTLSAESSSRRCLQPVLQPVLLLGLHAPICSLSIGPVTQLRWSTLEVCIAARVCLRQCLCMRTLEENVNAWEDT